MKKYRLGYDYLFLPNKFIILEYCYNQKIEINTYDISTEVKQKYEEKMKQEKSLINI